MVRCLLITAIVLLGVGCQQPSPTYNRYAPTLQSGSVLETADDLVQSAHDVLDTIDQRVENVVY